MQQSAYDNQKAQVQQIGNRLRWVRELLGVTATELAAAIGVDTSALRHIERGARLPSIPMLMALCHVLRISP